MHPIVMNIPIYNESVEALISSTSREIFMSKIDPTDGFEKSFRHEKSGDEATPKLPSHLFGRQINMREKRNNNLETSDPLRYSTMNIIRWMTDGKR